MNNYRNAIFGHLLNSPGGKCMFSVLMPKESRIHIQLCKYIWAIWEHSYTVACTFHPSWVKREVNFVIHFHAGVAPPSFFFIRAGTTLYELTMSTGGLSVQSVVVTGLLAIMSLVPVVLRRTFQKKLEWSHQLWDISMAIISDSFNLFICKICCLFACTCRRSYLISRITCTWRQAFHNESMWSCCWHIL